MANERQQKLQEEANRLGKRYDIPALGDLIVATALRYDLDPTIFLALVKQESGFNPQIVSPVGAQGLGQLMPGTAQELGVQNSFDPVENLDGAARYLRQQLDTFGSYELALAAYNAGPGNVQQYGGIPPFPETQNYVRSVMANADFRRSPGVASFRVPPTTPTSVAQQAVAAQQGEGQPSSTPAENIAAQPPEEQKKSLVRRIIEAMLNALAMSSDTPFGVAIRENMEKALERKSNRDVLDLAVQVGSLTEQERKQILDNAPIGAYETQDERLRRLADESRAEQAGQARTAPPGAGTATPPAAEQPGDEQQTVQDVLQQLMQAQNQAAREQTAITGLIALLGQRIAGGELSLRQAEAQLDRFFKQKGLELSRAIEEGTRLSQANTQLLQALPFVAPPGMQFFPGFEPGGAIQQITGGRVSPVPITRVQFNPFNQVAPIRNVELGQPPNPPALTQPLVPSSDVQALRNVLWRIISGQTQTPAFLGGNSGNEFINPEAGGR